MAQTEDDVDGTDSELDEETEKLLAAADELEIDCGGWASIDQVGAAVANWVDDPDEPVVGVTVLSTGTTVPAERYDDDSEQNSSRRRRRREVSGYKLSVGPTRTDGGTATTIDEWYGTPDQTPREVSHDIYLDVLRRARMWLQFHSPRAKRIEACLDGYGPDPLPEQQIDADEGQGTLNEYGSRLGV